MTQVFRGPMVQRGHGLGSLFRGLVRTVLPVVKQVARKPIVKKLAKTALKTGVRSLQDVMAGESVGTAVKKNVKQSSRQLLSESLKRLNQPQTSSVVDRPLKRKVKRRRAPVSKKIRRDIFE